MNLEELTRRFRVLACDTVANPYLFGSEDIADWLTDAEAQAAVRGRLLLDDSTPAVCSVSVQPGVFSYKLHPKLYELVMVRFKPANEQRSCELKLKTREWLDANVWNWRDWDDWQRGDVGQRFAVQGETGLRIVPAPAEAGELIIEGYRLPLRPLANENDKPEIHEASHEKLIQWALHRAFGIQDADSFDPQRSAAAEAEFTRYFGPLPDADMRRTTRSDQAQHNTVHLP